MDRSRLFEVDRHGALSESIAAIDYEVVCTKYLDMAF